MKERELQMQADITPEWELKMHQLMEIPCVHSVTWWSAERIEIRYVQHPTAQQLEQIQELTKIEIC
jgi:hypothetical protein